MEHLLTKAKDLQEQKNYERAIFYYSLVLFHDADNYEAFQGRGYCKLQQGKQEGSKDLIVSAINDIEHSISIANARHRDLALAKKHLQIANSELSKIDTE